MTVAVAAASILSQTFRFLKLDRVSSFGDDSDEVQDANEQYPIARAMVLEAHDFSSASTLVKLPEVTDTGGLLVDPDLPHFYRLPPDCLLIRHVYDDVQWRKDGRYVRADYATNITVRYTRDLQIETDMSATLQTAVAAQLALLMAPRWLSTVSKEDRLAQAAERYLQMAINNDGEQASPNRYDVDRPDTVWSQEATC